MRVSATERASQALRWLFLLNVGASLLHFAHNAEYLAQYPNLPTSWSRADVYLAWCCVTTLGALGYLFYVRGSLAVGLTCLTLYAVLGFGGLLHYTRAPLTQHSSIMNVTIWSEALAAALLLVSVAVVAADRARAHAA